MLFGAHLAACGNPSEREGDGLGNNECGIDLEVAGSTFSPGTCEFEIVTAGPACEDNLACPPDYVIRMTDGDDGHLLNVMLFGFAGLEKRTYRFAPAEDTMEFNGQATDADAVARNLTRGEVSLDPLGADEGSVKVSFDVFFAADISVRGSGQIVTRSIALP